MIISCTSIIYDISEIIMTLAGVFLAAKKDGTKYFRSSFTYKSKHISLGSYETEQEAHEAYLEAQKIVGNSLEYTIENYRKVCKILSFDKYVVLVNFRDKNIYIKTPIYLMNKYFIYYLSENEPLKFDVDDLFYYSNHSIMKRQGYLFVADYGMQVNILSRYGIKNHAVKGRDYIFVNGDEHDFRYHNIEVINKFYGVEKVIKNGRDKYRAKIHINGDYVLGTYSTENEAAFAYNKAITLLKEKGINKTYSENYLGDISAIEYAKLNTNVKLSKKFRTYLETLSKKE